MDTSPRVSVIIVTLNAASHLQRCLNSIYNQKYPFLDIIVIDGGSTDGTANILKKNSGKLSYWRSEPDNGIYDAMNKALDKINSQWVYFLGADDVLFDDFSQMLYKLTDCCAIYYGKVFIKGEQSKGPVNDYFIAKSNICQQAIIYPAKVFKTYRYNTKYPINADHLLNMQCCNDKNFHFEFIDLTVANFNHTGVSSLKVDAQFEKDRAALVFANHNMVIWLRFLFRQFKTFIKKRRYQTHSKAGQQYYGHQKQEFIPDNASYTAEAPAAF